MENKVNFGVKKLLNCHVNSAEFLRIEFFPSGERVFEKVSQKLAKESFQKLD